MIADLVFVTALLLSGALALYRGFCRESLTMVAWIGAVFATLYGFPYLSSLLGDMMESGLIADVISAATIFIVTLVILTIFTHIVADRVKGSMLGHLDSALGFVFGLLRGAVVLSLIYIGATIFWDDKDFPKPITEAKTLPMIKAGAGMLTSLAPDDLLPKRQDLERGVEDAVEGAIKDLPRDKLNQMIEEIEAEDRLRRLTQPVPVEGATSLEGDAQAPEGYDDAQRREMQRLIESNQ